MLRHIGKSSRAGCSQCRPRDRNPSTPDPVALQSVPEPTSIVLATAALGLLGWTSRRKARI
jgi:hypothetical protein